MTSIPAVPTSYSKLKTKNDFIQALAVYPKQMYNTSEAFKGKVFELCDFHGGPVGTLAEYAECHGLDVQVNIKASDGIISVRRFENGDWRVWKIWN